MNQLLMRHVNMNHMNNFLSKNPGNGMIHGRLIYGTTNLNDSHELWTAYSIAGDYQKVYTFIDN